MDHRYLFVFGLVVLPVSGTLFDDLAAAQFKSFESNPAPSPAAAGTGENWRSLVFYIHDILNATEAGIPASAYLVAVPLTATLPSSFGSILVMDDKITATPDYNSTEIGRAQGKYTVVNLSGSPVLFYEFAAVFSSGKLCFFGQRPIYEQRAEIAVFGCGGRFRRGTAVAEMTAVFVSPSGLNEIILVSAPVPE